MSLHPDTRRPSSLETRHSHFPSAMACSRVSLASKGSWLTSGSTTNAVSRVRLCSIMRCLSDSRMMLSDEPE